METAAHIYAFMLLAAIGDNAAVLSLIGVVVAALIAGWVQVRNLKQTLEAQREANESAERARVQAAAAELGAVHARESAEALRMALSNNVELIEALQRDNDRLRNATGACEKQCDVIRQQLRKAQDELAQERRETHELMNRVGVLEGQLGQGEKG